MNQDSTTRRAARKPVNSIAMSETDLCCEIFFARDPASAAFQVLNG
jgi:hypothetical protein